MTIFTFFRWDSCIWREHFGTSKVLVGPLFFYSCIWTWECHRAIPRFICKSKSKVHMQEYLFICKSRWFICKSRTTTLAYELFHTLLLLHVNLDLLLHMNFVAHLTLAYELYFFDSCICTLWRNLTLVVTLAYELCDTILLLHMNFITVLGSPRFLE